VQIAQKIALQKLQSTEAVISHSHASVLEGTDVPTGYPLQQAVSALVESVIVDQVRPLNLQAQRNDSKPPNQSWNKYMHNIPVPAQREQLDDQIAELQIKCEETLQVLLIKHVASLYEAPTAIQAQVGPSAAYATSSSKGTQH